MTNATPEIRPRRRRRRWLRVLVLLVLLVVVLVGAAPYLVVKQPLRGWMLGAAVRDLKGEVAVEDASWGWTAPLGVRGIEVRPTDGETLLSIPLVQGKRTLWEIVTSPTEGDTIRIERPTLTIIANESGSNLTSLLGRPPVSRDESQPLPKLEGWWRRFGGTIQFVDAGVSVQSAGTAAPWRVEGINLSVSLIPETAAPEQCPVVALESGRLLDETPITPEMCDDALKFVAPILAKATRAEGRITIELDRCRVPLDDPQAASVAGRLAIHSVEVGPGPLVRELATALKLPPEIELVRGSVVEFEVRDRRVHHRDLEFGLPGVRVRTSGSVGFDESLDLIAEFPLPEHLMGDTPFGRALGSQTVRVPIKGTVDEPKFDLEGLGATGLAALLGSMDQLMADEQLRADLLAGKPLFEALFDRTGDEGREGKEEGRGTSADGESTSDAAARAGRMLLRRFLDRPREQ